MDYQGEFTGPQIDERLTLAGTAYQKPASGIPASDLSEGVQESLGRADTAYQKPEDGIPASDIKEGVIPDVSQFITKSVNDLVNYYLKSETYTRAEVQALIGAIQNFHYEIAASTSAVTDPQSNVLYLIGPTGSGADKYEEYVWPDAQTGWVKIGDTSIDLSGYVTTEALNAALADYQTKANLLSAWQATPDNLHYPSEKLVYDSMFVRGVISQTQTWTQAADGGYDYTMSDLVYGNIPKSFIDQVIAEGATFNAVTGYFELNDLVDISYDEMIEIWNHKRPQCQSDLCFALSSKKIRTNFTFFKNAENYFAAYGNSSTPEVYCVGLAKDASNLSSVYLASTESSSNLRDFLQWRSAYQMLYGCAGLKLVYGIINAKNLTTTSGIEIATHNCKSLETIKIANLTRNISFGSSPRLSVESILYMINYQAATSAITITLHATAYARAIADADITAALANHPNVSLASA